MSRKDYVKGLPAFEPFDSTFIEAVRIGKHKPIDDRYQRKEDAHEPAHASSRMAQRQQRTSSTRSSSGRH